jgi:transposase
VLAKEKTATERLWTYVRDDRPFGGVDPPTAAFHYSGSRSGEYPREHLAAYAGIMQVDAYAGYNDLCDGKRKPAPVIEAACWSQGRRRLFDLTKLTKAAGRRRDVAPHRRDLYHRTHHSWPDRARAPRGARNNRSR